MRKHFVAATFFCLISLTALAAEQQFHAFSVDVPEGWEPMGDSFNQPDLALLMLVNQDKGAALTISFGPMTADSLREIAEAAKSSLTVQGGEVKTEKTAGNRHTIESTQSGANILMILSADPDTRSMASLNLTGNLEEALKVARTITFKNKKLAFF
jgi:hypothetical protein